MLGEAEASRVEVAQLRRQLSKAPAGGVGKAAAAPADSKRAGMLLVQEKRYEESLAPLRAHLAADPSDLTARRALARSLFELNQYRDAAGQLKKIVKLSPQDSASALLLGKCYESLALAAYRAILAAGPDSCRAHQVIAQIYEARSERDKAIEEYRAANTACPSMPGLHLSLAQVLEQDMQLDDAEREYQQELKINPADVEANAKLGSLLVYRHEAGKGMPHLESAIRLKPDLLPARKDLGKAYFQLGDFEKAVTQLRLALPDDHDGSTYYLLGTTYQRLGRAEEAKRAFDQMTRIKSAALAKQGDQIERGRKNDSPGGSASKTGIQR